LVANTGSVCLANQQSGPNLAYPHSFALQVGRQSFVIGCRSVLCRRLPFCADSVSLLLYSEKAAIIGVCTSTL